MLLRKRSMVKVNSVMLSRAWVVPPSQNFGNQQNEGFGQFNQQPATRQQPPRTPSAQQQLAKQQQMLVQKKQQLAQQQKGIQQKQQMAQQKQSQQKQQENLELKKKKELEEQKQKELELQKQKELELQKQKELELQKQKELELEKQKALELQKQKELELQKQKELELQKQKELELQKQKELELQKQQELELQKQKEQEELAKKELEQQKQVQEEEGQKDNDAETMEVEQSEEGPCPDGAPEPPISGGDTENRPARRRFPQRNRKLSKYEIQRRRNLRLSKLLQPKSAMVILNEVGKSVTYNVERSQTRPGPKGYMFKATVVVDDTTHEGYGLSKASAKNEAAEKALKFLVKNKKLIQTTATEPTTNPPETEEAMDTTEKVEKPLDIPLAWQQFASFAIYKLLDSWGEDLEVIKEDVKVDKKPAKKLPPNPELINPLMLMNQMLPRVNFLELPKTSNGPFNTFNFQAVVDGQTFNGSGVSKKVAKRAVAFAICNEVLGIQYPPEVYTPPVKSEALTPQPEVVTC
ncbi:transcription factor SPT20 homolog isoform X2 [Coccinella septempunctata]|uniref:transcription factor SPT20 homolog isoform X2 n=1 Tax=Coccinella septempunctata TaxID=41139 RepID=UPI001D0850F9|nr:transcription factor SPT20 homolog isoform X2 [Coccinella septempunctata]